MNSIHVVEGPVGAGKSTYALDLASRMQGVHIALDEWFAKLFSPDRPSSDFVPWYMERKQRLLDLIWRHALSLAEAGTAPVLELGLVQRQAREDIYQRAREAGISLAVYMLDAPREVRRDRVRRRNDDRGATFFMVVPEAVFELASDLWEPPDDLEVCDHDIRFVSGTRHDY
jgi:predicted kinase